MDKGKRGRGRPRKVIVETVPDTTEFQEREDFLPEQEPSNPDSDIAAMSDELENVEIMGILNSPDIAGAVCRIYKVNVVTLKPEYVTQIPAKSFLIENIKKTYGGGEYRMFIVRANGKDVISRSFTIDSRFKGELDIMPNSVPVSPNGSVSNGEKGLTQLGMQLANMLGNKLDEIKRVEKDETMPLLLQQMRDSAQMQMTMLTEFAKSMKPTGDTMSIIVSLAPIILEFIKIKKKDGSSLTEIIGAMVQLRDLTGGNDNGDPRDK